MKNIDERISGKLKIETVVIIAFGLAFILAIIFLVVLFPRPTPFQYIVFRTLLSLAAAGIGAAIPGFINVKLSWRKNISVRAAGALAVFVIIYFLNPAQLAIVESTPVPTSAPFANTQSPTPTVVSPQGTSSTVTITTAPIASLKIPGKLETVARLLIFQVIKQPIGSKLGSYETSPNYFQEARHH